jgi:hypothetical protein
MSDFNNDVSSSSQIPGTFLEISTSPTSTVTTLPKDLFLLATAILQGSAITGSPYNLTAGTADPNDIEQYSDVNRVNLAFNRRSPIANRFRSALQEVLFGINIFPASIPEPDNSGFAGFATKLIKAVGVAVGSGQVSLRVCGFQAFAAVANGDNAATVAESAKSAIDDQILDAPMVTADLINIELPVITIATNATGTSNFVIIADGITKTVPLTATWTPAQSATAIAAALAGDAAFPLTATSLAGVVSASWRSGFHVSTITISTTDATQTFVLSYPTSGGGAGVTVPLTYVVRGQDGNDSPLVVTVPPEITGLKFSPGGVTIAATSVGHSSAASLFTITVGSLSVVSSIPATTTAANSAIIIASDINQATFPLSSESTGATFQLYFRSGWVFNRLSVASTEDAMGQTYRLYDQHDSAGAIGSVVTVPGTATPTALQGSGVPALTTVLDNKAKLPAMIEWVSDYVDLTSINAEVQHVETYANGFYQHGQRTTRCDTEVVDTVAAIGPACTPALGNYWRHSIVTYQDPPSQGGSYATQIGARLCATDLPYNMDGRILKGGSAQPLLPARADTEFSPTTLDVILGSYRLTPLKGVNGQVTIVRGKSTWTGQGRWGDWSYGRIFDQVRFELGAFLTNRFAGKVLFTQTANIRVLNAFTLTDVRNAIGEYLDSRNGIIIDGSQTLKQLIIVTIDSVDESRILLQVAARPPVENHQRVGKLVAAAS